MPEIVAANFIAHDPLQEKCKVVPVFLWCQNTLQNVDQESRAYFRNA